MSLRISVLALALLAGTPVAHAATLRVDGEVYAQRSAQLVPPAVDRLWQFNLTQLAPDGSTVKKGDIVVAFDTNELVRQLAEKQSLLQEKKRELENLTLDVAERERSQRLATAEAEAERDKAARKTQQPRELIAALEYDKLVEDRRRTERLAVLAQRAERAAAEQRRQELRLVTAELQQAQADVTRLQTSIAALTLAAPRDGVIMHKSNWNGEKFDVGSQVWKGMSVAEIPDTGTLAVRAQLPERELTRVKVGAPARIVIEGGAGSALNGRVTAIGRTVRSKSRVQPIPVLDVEIKLDNPRAKLKPGQPVRVELSVADAGSLR